MTHHSVEHAYQAEKARFFGFRDIETAITTQPEPRTTKLLSKDI